MTRKKLTPEQQVDLTMQMGDVWKALGGALHRLKEYHGLVGHVKVNLEAGTFRIRFEPREAGKK